MTEQENFYKWMREDISAVYMLEKIFKVSQIADDFVDGDKPMKKSQDMSELLMLSLVEIPAMKFYRDNQGFIAPVLVSVIAAFNTSNQLQKSQITDCAMMAWALRDSLEHLITVCAYVKGGSDWALQVSQEATEYFRTNEDRESFADWVKT